MVYANDIMHIHIQMKAANIYIASIYMYARLGLDVYGPYTCIYTRFSTPIVLSLELLKVHG